MSNASWGNICNLVHAQYPTIPEAFIENNAIMVATELSQDLHGLSTSYLQDAPADQSEFILPVLDGWVMDHVVSIEYGLGNHKLAYSKDAVANTLHITVRDSCVHVECPTTVDCPNGFYAIYKLHLDIVDPPCQVPKQVITDYGLTIALGVLRNWFDNKRGDKRTANQYIRRFALAIRKHRSRAKTRGTVGIPTNIGTRRNTWY